MRPDQPSESRTLSRLRNTVAFAVVNDLSSQEGLENRDLCNLVCRHGEEIGSQDHEVGQLAGFNGAQLVLFIGVALPPVGRTPDPQRSTLKRTLELPAPIASGSPGPSPALQVQLMGSDLLIRLIHDLTPDDRRQNRKLLIDLILRYGQEVAAQDHQVSQLPGFNGAQEIPLITP